MKLILTGKQWHSFGNKIKNLLTPIDLTIFETENAKNNAREEIVSRKNLLNFIIDCPLTDELFESPVLYVRYYEKLLRKLKSDEELKTLYHQIISNNGQPVYEWLLQHYHNGYTPDLKSIDLECLNIFYTQLRLVQFSTLQEIMAYLHDNYTQGESFEYRFYNFHKGLRQGVFNNIYIDGAIYALFNISDEPFKWLDGFFKQLNENDPITQNSTKNSQ